MTVGRKMGLRVLLGAGVFLTLLLTGASAAYACNAPTIGVNPDEAEAGAGVHFTIDNTQPGAEYTVWLDGKEIAEGVDTTPESGVEGEFLMPDLGPQPREDVKVASLVEHRSTAAHGDAEYVPDSVDIDYRVPASTPREGTPPEEEPPGSNAGGKATDPPRETSDRSDEAGSDERDDRSGAGGREKREHFSPLAAPIARRQVDRDGPVGAAPAAASVRGARDANSGGESTSGESTSRGSETGATGEQSLASGTRAAARQDTGAARAPGRPALARSHDAPITEIGATRPAHAALPAPSALVLGLALLALVASSMIAVVAVWRRRGGPNDADEASVTPPWVPPVVDAEARARDLLIEGELQEMIAEHRAHELVSRPPLEPSSPAASGEDVPASAGATADGLLAGVGQS